MPANARRLINASALTCIFTLYSVLVWRVLLFLSMCSGFKLNQYESKKTMDKKNPQQTESGDKVPRINPSEQDWLKHRLINVEAAPVLIRYAWETA